jgi:flagellar hook assembly protein FlgD
MGIFRLRGHLFRRVVLGLLAAPLFLAPALTGTSMAAAAEPGPVITSPTAGQQVGGEIQVTVESTAPYVLIAWGPEADSQFVDAVRTDEGTATMSLSTSGYDGPSTIVARECQTPCSGDSLASPEAQTTMRVEVANPAPQWNENAWLSEIHGDALLWGVREDWAWYGFWLDGQFVHPVTHMPYLEIDVDKLGDGEHTVQFGRCSEYSQRTFETSMVCTLGNVSQLRRFTVRTALHPTIDAVQRGVISPDGNGVADTTEVTMTADSRQAVGWDLMEGSASLAGGSFDTAAPGQHTFTIDGLNPDGDALPTGTYVLRLRSFSLPSGTPGVDDTMITGQTSTTLQIDLDAPSVTNAAATPAAFRPAVRDHVTVTGELSEPASRLRVRLLRHGTVVRSLWLGPQPAGTFAATWDGRRPNGTVMRAGTYRYQFLSRDRFGNTAIAPGGRIELRSSR